ncbi:hypothetical protein GCM10012279_45730 [Micromonospora yangpuensis]|nr:hypothetical protein GCM10012279_45730 [Micromonospora yangpuensis]
MPNGGTDRSSPGPGAPYPGGGGPGDGGGPGGGVVPGWEDGAASSVIATILLAGEAGRPPVATLTPP